MERLEDSLAQMKGIPVVTLSALTGAGVERLLPAVRAAHEVWNKRVPTGELNRWFEHALETHQAPLVSGRRLKLRYVTQAKARPPTFVVFGTRAEQTPEDYSRYLVNSLRETFKLPGTPIRLQFRGTKNPFADEGSGPAVSGGGCLGRRVGGGVFLQVLGDATGGLALLVGFGPDRGRLASVAWWPRSGRWLFRPSAGVDVGLFRFGLAGAAGLLKFEQAAFGFVRFAAEADGAAAQA